MPYSTKRTEKAELTHRTSSEIMAAEKKARLEKTDRLRQARLATLAGVVADTKKT
jgi:hypothetical protein